MKENNTDTTPKYRQIRQWFLDNVAEKKFKLNQKVPAETELMDIHNVSRATIRRAMDELEIEGMIRRYRGKGTFLLVPRPTAKVRNTRVFRWGCVLRHWVANRDNILSGVESLAQQMGNEVIVEYVGEKTELVQATVDRMIKLGVDGMVLEPSPYLSEEIYRPLFKANIHVVCLHMPLVETGAPLVAYDHRRSGHDATRFLLEMKHQVIGCVSSPSYWSIDQMIEGWREALREYNLEPQDQWLGFESTVTDENSFAERGYQATLKLLSLPQPPTALIALNDETAANAYRAVKSQGLRIPQDISVIAMDSSSKVIPASLDPPLMVWHGWRAHRRLGEQLAQTLNQLCNGQIEAKQQTFLIEDAVIPHGSVGLAPNKSS